MPNPTPLARQIAEKADDAYSTDRYNSWPAVAQVCLEMGYDARQTEAIMRSKYTRWAADMSSARYGTVPAKALLDLRQLSPELFSPQAIAELVEGTF